MVYSVVETEGVMHDQGTREGRVMHISFHLQMGYGLEKQRVGDFASSWKHEVRRVVNVVSLRLLVRLEDFAVSWSHGEIEGVKVHEPVEMVISVFFDGQLGTGMTKVRFVLK